MNKESNFGMKGEFWDKLRKIMEERITQVQDRMQNDYEGKISGEGMKEIARQEITYAKAVLREMFKKI